MATKYYGKMFNSLILLIPTLAICFLLSCTSESNKASGSPQRAMAATDSALVFKSLIFPQKIFKDYYSRPKFKKFVFQFYFPTFDSLKDSVRLVCHAIDSSNGVIDLPFLLEYENTRQPKKFNGGGILGNLELSRAAIRDLFEIATDTFPKFDYILLEPKKLYYHVTYTPSVEGGPQEQQSGGRPPRDLDPSPPAPPKLLNQ